MKWKYDGVMSIYEDTGNPRHDRRVLELGCGLGSDTEKIGRLSAAAPDLLKWLEVAVEIIKNEYPPDQWGDYGVREMTAAIIKATGGAA